MKNKESDPAKLPLSQYTETTYVMEFSDSVREYSSAMYREIGNQIRTAAFEFDDDKQLGKQALLIMRAFFYSLEIHTGVHSHF